MAEHERVGGVVPEIASRAHLEAMVPTVHRALADAGATLDDVDAVAVPSGPGVTGALLVGGGARQGAGVGEGKAAVRRQPPGRARGGRRAAARSAGRTV